jgi:predicted nuclease of predicted toxin-antitoxin system
MTKRSVQLDKSAGGRKLRDLCNAEGSVACYLLPESIRDTATDAEVVLFAKKRGNLTVTFDVGFAVSAKDALSPGHPGILILREDDSSLRQLTTKTAPQLLGKLKNELPDWHSLPWNDAIVEITPTLVYVYELSARAIGLRALLKQTQPGWQGQLRELLHSADAESLPNAPADKPADETPE